MSSDALAVTVPENKLQLLRDTYAKGSTPQEFELFVAVCNRLRLDPFARQIYAVKRYDSSLKREVMQAQVSIDGMRLTAERTGVYAGQAAPQWCGYDGVWLDVWLADEPPAAARVAVLRRDFAQPIVGIALFREYAQYKQGGELTKFWATMPANQLAKCAESLALRKAFPNELSGVYTADELPANDNDTPPPPPPQPKPPIKRASEIPRFHAAWSNPLWAGKPLDAAPQHVLAEYLDALDRVLGDMRRKRLHDELRAARALAVAAYDKLVAETMDTDQPALAPPDPIAEGLQAEHDKATAGPVFVAEADSNEAWGLR